LPGNGGVPRDERGKNWAKGSNWGGTNLGRETLLKFGGAENARPEGAHFGGGGAISKGWSSERGTCLQIVGGEVSKEKGHGLD